MTDHAWKQFERRVAEWIGGKRKPANSGFKVDAEGPLFVAQCKEVKSLSLAELTRLLDQAEADGEECGKFGMVGVKLRARKPTTALAVLSGETFAALIDIIEVLKLEVASLRPVEISPAEEPATSPQGVSGGRHSAVAQASRGPGMNAEVVGAAAPPSAAASAHSPRSKVANEQ